MNGLLAASIEFASAILGQGFGADALFLALIVVLVLLTVALILSMRLLSRRRWSGEIREIVRTLEQLRSGDTRVRAEVEAHSPLTVVADAVNRLCQDLQVRLGELVSANERLRLVMDAFKDSAIITTDMDSDIRSFSAGAQALFGWTEQEAVSQPSATLFEESAYKEFLPKLTRRSLRERSITTRSTLKRKDGTTFPANLTVHALYGSKRGRRPARDHATEHAAEHTPEHAAREHREHEDAIGMLLVIQDVTAQARLETELRRSEERYRRLVEGLSDGVVIVRDGRLLYVNPAFSGMCALPGARLVGTPLRDRIATRDVLMIEERLARLQEETGAEDVMTTTMVGLDEQTRIDARLHATSIDYEGGNAVLLLVHDETASRRIEHELRRNESQLDAVLEATSDGILVIVDGAQGGIVQMTNRAFLRLFALQQAEVLGRPEERLIAVLRERAEAATGRDTTNGGAWGNGTERDRERDRERDTDRPREEDGRQVLAAMLAARRAVPRTETFRLGGRSPRDVEAQVVALRDREGRRIGRVVVCRDLTRQRESERSLQDQADQLQLSKVMLEKAYAELDRANQDLKARTAELDRLNQELRRLDEMRKQLLGNVSHELQAPLVAIRGYTEMTLKQRLGPITEEQRKGLTLSLKNIDRLISLIDGLTGEPPAEDETLVVTTFALRTLIEEAAALLRDKMEAKGIHFSMGGTDGEEVRADRDRILQVFINLLSNAIKFNREGGSIEVRIRPGEPGHLSIDVEDTGVGIPAEAVPRIFDRHYQVTETEGHGLGLAIVQEILRRHGCRIEVHSEVGRGTRMSFTLPLASGSRLDQRPGDDQAAVDRGPREAQDSPHRRNGRNRAASEIGGAGETQETREQTREEETKEEEQTKEEQTEETRGAETNERKPPAQSRFRIIRRYGKR